MTKNNRNLFGARKLKIYEVAKNDEMHRRMSKENDFKREKNFIIPTEI